MKFGSKKRWRSFGPLRGKSAARFCFLPKVESDDYGPGRTPVYLNVYDLTPINRYLYWAGLGIFHSGLEVHGVEYAFGAHDYPTSGVFEIEPRLCPGFKFKKSIFIGTTSLNQKEVREFMEDLACSYNGSVCSCVLPESLKIAAVPHNPEGQPAEDSEKQSLQRSFSFLSSISMRQKQLSTSSLLIQSPLRGCLPPWQLKRSKSNSSSLKER